MTSQSSNNDSLESRKNLPEETQSSGLVFHFSERYNLEPLEISKAVKCMEEAIMSGRVKEWAKRSDFIGSTTGFSSPLTEIEKAYEVSQIADKTYDEVEDELGGLRVFNPVENDKYLEAINNDAEELTVADSPQMDYEADQISRIEAATELVAAVYEGMNQLEDISQLNDSNFTLTA